MARTRITDDGHLVVDFTTEDLTPADVADMRAVMAANREEG